jgi:hypothetical protein
MSQRLIQRFNSWKAIRYTDWRMQPKPGSLPAPTRTQAVDGGHRVHWAGHVAGEWWPGCIGMCEVLLVGLQDQKNIFYV